MGCVSGRACPRLPPWPCTRPRAARRLQPPRSTASPLHTRATSMESGTAPRTVGLTIPIDLWRTATRLRPTGFIRTAPLDARPIIVAVRMKPYSFETLFVMKPYSLDGVSRQPTGRRDSFTHGGLSMPNAGVGVRVADAWLAVASFLLGGALAFHGPLAADLDADENHRSSGHAVGCGSLDCRGGPLVVRRGRPGRLGSRVAVDTGLVDDVRLGRAAGRRPLDRAYAVAEATAVADAAAAGNRATLRRGGPSLPEWPPGSPSSHWPSPPWLATRLGHLAG
jgi:hypothetical protein